MPKILVLLLAFWAGAAGAGTDSLASVVVEYREVEMGYPAEAVVEAVSQATVAAQVQGRVTEVKVDVGDRVRRGDVLMRIDGREAAQGVAGAQAGVAQAQAELANARASFERTKNLFERKFVSQSALDTAQSAYRSAEAQVKAAQASRGQAGTTQSFTTVLSPIDGIVSQRHTELGEMATPGKPLLTLHDPSDLRVTAEVPQHKLDAVRSSMRAKVEFPESGRWVEAKSLTLLPTADARTHSVRVRVDLPPKTEGVVPGLFARVHFLTGQARKLVVPAQAVLRRGEVTAVYVMDDKGAPRLRQVRLGEEAANGSVEILAGVSAGERVALEPIKTGISLKQTLASR